MAAHVNVFGPKTYDVAAGAPRSVTESIALSGPCDSAANAVYTLVAKNDGVSSASIRVNGTEVIAERDFNQQVTTIERTVTLTAPATLTATIKGGTRNGSLIISIRRHMDVREAVFGEKTYTTTGKSDTFRDSFSVADPAGEFSIAIRNGATPVSSAIVRLNGAEVTSQQSVTLRASNELVIETKSDGAGASLLVTVFRHVADAAGPQIALNGLSEGDLVGVNPLPVSGVVSDPSGVASLTINGVVVGVGAAGAFSAEVPVAPGPNTLVFEASDCEGNTSRREVPVIFDVAPRVEVLSPRNGSATNRSTLELNGIVTAFRGVQSVVANGVPMTVSGSSWSGSIDISGPDGPRPITVVVTDNTGRQGTVSLTITVDTVAPTISGTVQPPPNANGWINTLAVVEFSCNDAGSGVADCTTVKTVATAGANQQITGEVRDAAGNTASATVIVNIDRAAPHVTLDPIESAATTPTVASAFLTLTGTVDETLSGIHSLTCNGAAAVVSGSRFSCQVELQPGANTVPLQAVDRAGNEASGFVTVTLDVTAPSLFIAPPADGSEPIEEATVQLTGYTDDESGVASATVNGQSVAISAGKFVKTLNLAEGENPVTIVVTDRVGNARTQTITIERRTPVRVAITAPADLSTVMTPTVTVTGTVSPSNAAVVVNDIPAIVSGGTFTAAAVPLAQGRTVITAVATAPSGVVAVANLNIFRDSIRPRVVVYSPAQGAVVRQSPISVAGMVDDIVVGTINSEQVSVTVNGIDAAVQNRAFLAENVPLTAGANTLTVVATDQAGNSTEITRAVTLDTSGARLTIVSGNGQDGVIGAALANPLVVRATDASGAAIRNAAVTFSVVQNNGMLSNGSVSDRSVTVSTDTRGEAFVRWTLGTRAGAGNHRVTASAAQGTVEFHAAASTGAPDKIVVDMGGSQFGLVNERVQRPLIAIVVDAGSNRLGNVPVTFTVIGGGGHIDGQQSVTIRTDSDGRAWVSPTLGPESGNDNNIFEATVPGVPARAMFLASGRDGGPPAQTRISGVVLDNSDIPIAGVTLRVDETTLSAQSNAQGQFTIAGVPAGYVKLIVDGSTAQRPGTWPTLEFVMYTLPGEDNTLGMPIYLLPIDVARGIQVDETRGGTLTLPELPGFSLTVAGGSALFPNGSRAGTVSATLVHPDKMPMPPSFGQQPKFVVTIQPVGVHFDPPAPMTLPNLDGLAPGEVTELFSFDHDLGQFVSIGTGSVSADGSTIVSDPGVGIIKGGWHGGGNPNPVGNASSVSVQLSLPEAMFADSIVNVTATGTPATGGTYSNWSVIDDPADPNDDPSAAVFLNQPSCPGQGTCVAQLKVLSAGIFTVSVTYTTTSVASATTGQITTNAVSSTQGKKKGQASALEVDALMFMMGHQILVDKATMLPHPAGPTHWVRPILPNDPFVQQPAAYTRSIPAGAGAAQPNKITVKVKFRIKGTMAQSIEGVTITGTGSGLTWKKEGVVIPAGAEYTPWMEIEAETALPETTKFYNPLLITWKYQRAADPAPLAAGATANPVYVTLRNPLNAVFTMTTGLSGATYLTAIHLGVSKDGASTDVQALTNIWSHFANPDGVDDLKAWDGRLIHYYRRPGFGFVQSFSNPLSVLFDLAASGQCGAISRMFENALDVNGISSVRKLVLAIDDTWFLVPNWSPVGSTYAGQEYPWKIEFHPSTVTITGSMEPPMPGGIYGDLKDEPGVPGQNSATPTQKLFANHVILLPNVVLAPYFDASYGVTRANEAAFEQDAVFGYMKFFAGNASLPTADRRVRPKGGPLNIKFVTDTSN